jgi:hypothetical protein
MKGKNRRRGGREKNNNYQTVEFQRAFTLFTAKKERAEAERTSAGTRGVQVNPKTRPLVPLTNRFT